MLKIKHEMYNSNYKYMLNQTGTQKGRIVTLRSRQCPMEGCTGWRIHVKWPDGKTTFPCSKGVRHVDNETLQII